MRVRVGVGVGVGVGRVGGWVDGWVGGAALHRPHGLERHRRVGGGGIPPS